MSGHDEVAREPQREFGKDSSQQFDELEAHLKELMDITEFYSRERAFRSEEDKERFMGLYQYALEGLSSGIEFTDAEEEKIRSFLERCLDIPPLRYFTEMRDVLQGLDAARARNLPIGTVRRTEEQAPSPKEAPTKPTKRRGFLDRLFESWLFAFVFGMLVMLILFKVCEYYDLVEFRGTLEFLSGFPF